MSERTRRPGWRLLLALAAAPGLVGAPPPAVSAQRATAEAAYTVLSLKATISSTQISHIGPGQDGDGGARVELASVNRPFFKLPGASTPRRVALRVSGSGDAHARFVFAGRGTAPDRTVECASTVRMDARSASASFQVVRGRRPGRRMVRVRVTLPYVRAPYVEATDLYPLSGPCLVQYEQLHRTRTVPLLRFKQPELVLRLGGRRTSRGDITYTTSWSVALTLRRRR